MICSYYPGIESRIARGDIGWNNLYNSNAEPSDSAITMTVIVGIAMVIYGMVLIF